MKYLDEQITITVPITGVTDSGVYKYQVMNVIHKAEENIIEDVDIFIGNMYIEAGTTSVVIDITEIVRNYTTKTDIFEKVVEGTLSGVHEENSGIEKFFNAKVTINDTTYRGSENECVLMQYRYPNIKNEMTANLAYNAESDDSFTYSILVSLQGRYLDNGSYKYKLTPRYPFKKTHNYSLIFAGYVGSDMCQTTFTIKRNDFPSIILGETDPKFQVYNDYNYLTAISLYDLTLNTVPMDFVTNVSVDDNVIANLDRCPANYYLMWQDRAGSFQSQPFDMVNTFSETFNREYITDYKGNKKPNTIIIEPKMKIQTGFIDQSLYPYYESIFTSPRLVLYDTKEDKSYLVNVTGDYIEKTFKNQSRQMFNLQLDLEYSKQQNIIY